MEDHNPMDLTWWKLPLLLFLCFSVMMLCPFFWIQVLMFATMISVMSWWFYQVKKYIEGNHGTKD